MELSALALLLFAATGFGAGVLAGLFGVGGGLIMVPALAVLLPPLGIPPERVMQTAVGTSLAVIALTSISSMLSHHRRGAVRWRLWAMLGPGLAAGAVGGAFVAHALPSDGLRIVVGFGALAVGVQMLLDLQPRVSHPMPGRAALLSAGGGIGLLSALIGIGGGSLVVPYLSGRGVAIREAVGTAAACGVPIAWAGAAGFMLAGPGALGYVALPAAGALALTSVAAAPLGAALAHRLPPKLLKRAFAVLLLGVGAGLLA